MQKFVLDACCGSRMFWFDRCDKRAVFLDKRCEKHLLKDKSSNGGYRELVVSPDVLWESMRKEFKESLDRFYERRRRRTGNLKTHKEAESS